MYYSNTVFLHHGIMLFLYMFSISAIFLEMYYGNTVVFLSTLEYHVNSMVYENDNQIYCRYISITTHNLNVFWCIATVRFAFNCFIDNRSLERNVLKLSCAHIAKDTPLASGQTHPQHVNTLSLWKNKASTHTHHQLCVCITLVMPTSQQTQSHCVSVIDSLSVFRPERLTRSPHEIRILMIQMFLRFLRAEVRRRADVGLCQLRFPNLQVLFWIHVLFVYRWDQADVHNTHHVAFAKASGTIIMAHT